MNKIYVNGKKTNLSNIFDYVGYCDDLGRDVKEITDDWVKYRTTFYYVNNERVYFTLIQA